MRRIITRLVAIVATIALALGFSSGLAAPANAASKADAPVVKAYNQAKKEAHKLGVDLVKLGVIKKGNKTLAHVYTTTGVVDDEDGFNATHRFYIVSSKRLAGQKPHTVRVSTKPDGGKTKTKTVKKVKSKLVVAKRTVEYGTAVKVTVTVKGKHRTFTVNSAS